MMTVFCNLVNSQLQHLNSNKAIGLDCITASLLKDASTVIIPSLTDIFNCSLQTATFPTIWIMDKVTVL